MALGVGDLTDTIFADESMAMALAFALLLLRNDAAEILLGKTLVLILLLVGLLGAFGVWSIPRYSMDTLDCPS